MKGILQNTMRFNSKYEEKLNDSSMIPYKLKAHWNNVTLKLQKKSILLQLSSKKYQNNRD